MEMENMKENFSYDLQFLLPYMKVTLKQLSKVALKNSCLQKLMSLRKASAAKLCNGIRRYFANQKQIGLFYLIAEGRIFQYLCLRIRSSYNI